MERIKIAEFVGNRALTMEEGNAVHDAIVPHLERGHAVNLDFGGVEDVATAFLNTAIGRLYGEFPPASLSALLNVSELNVGGQRSLEKVLINAQRFYTRPKEA